MAVVAERRPLVLARRVAEAFGETLAPACERIEIAGSVRRGKPDIGDLELVCIPRYRQEEGQKPDLFRPAPLLEVNSLWEVIQDLGPDICQPLKIGKSEGVQTVDVDPRWHRKRLRGAGYFKLLLPRSGFRVDLFLASPETWGVLFTIRTGSSDFSRALVTRWTWVSGGHSRDGILHDGEGRPVPTPEERDVFEACRVKYIAPPLRVDGSSLEPLP